MTKGENTFFFSQKYFEFFFFGGAIYVNQLQNGMNVVRDTKAYYFAQSIFDSSPLLSPVAFRQCFHKEDRRWFPMPVVVSLPVVSMK